MVSGSMDKTIKAWNSSSGELIRVLSTETIAISGLDIARDGMLISGADQNIKKFSKENWDLYSTSLTKNTNSYANTILPLI